MQPQAVVSQRTLGTAVDANEPMVAALERECELHVSTGDKFLEQWRPQYLSDTFCFDFPRGTGGPEFTTVARLRVAGAPDVTISTYTRGLPGRIERQIRTSWILVPALRSLLFRRSLSESANIAYRSNLTALEDSDAYGKGLVAAAQEIHGRLQNGTYLN